MIREPSLGLLVDHLPLGHFDADEATRPRAVSQRMWIVGRGDEGGKALAVGLLLAINHAPVDATLR